MKKDVRVQIWMEKELKDKTQKYCKENDLTFSQLTRKLLKRELDIIKPELPLMITRDYNSNIPSTIIRILTINFDSDINARKKILTRFNELNFHWAYIEQEKGYNENENLNLYIWNEELQNAINEIKKIITKNKYPT